MGTTVDPRSDAELLVAARTHTGAFEELYLRHTDRVVRFAARRATTPADVVDLVAAVWLEVVASLDRFDPGRGEGLPWILGIAANLCAVERRRVAREREAVRRLAGERTLDDEDVLRLERKIDAAGIAPRLREELTRLPRGERVVAELVLLDELTPTEAAAALGLHPAAVRMRLTRARRKLRSVAEERARPIERFEEVST
jgi:RNA polymerase sigma-70 factor (ECF subfamily)